MDETKLPETAPVEDAPNLRPDEGQLRALGQKLMSDFQIYESDRKIAELRWTRNLRQFLGQYDPEVNIPKDRSIAYPKLTRIKCVSMVARLMNLLFPSSEKNWGVEASPVPNLSQDDLQLVLDQLQQDPEAQLTDEVITNAVREFAKKRAKNLETEIEDQLTELGGAKMVSYVQLCKRVLMSGVLYGMGVLKGPMARSRTQRRWKLDPASQKVIATDEVILVPQFEFTPLWDYYPDMTAKYLHQMDGQFQRMVMSRAQLRDLANNSEFFGVKINQYLRDHQTGNYKAKQHEQELKTMGVAVNSQVADGRKYEILVWDGGLSGHYLKGCGINIPDAKLHEMIGAIVWVLDSVVIRATLNPWLIVGEERPIASYHHFVFEEDDTSLMGNGLPAVMRDSQLGVAATARMLLDNAGVVCGPNVEVNKSLLLSDQDSTNIHAYKVWERDDDSPATINVPAVRSISFDSHIDELLKINDLFKNFADAETFVSPATGGDMQKGPSEPFRTAAGASMIRGEAALPFKDVVRNFDVFTESVIGALVMFNKHFNAKPSVKGDFQPVSRGSTSLIAKEVRGMAADELARSITPGEALYVNWRKLAQERVAVRDMDPSVLVDDAEAKRREDAQAESQSQQNDQMSRMFEATLRKTLAEAVKNLTQADKNSAAADAEVFNTVLDGLEKGATPKDIAEVRTGSDEIPDGMLTMAELQHPEPVAPEGGSSSKGKQ